MENYLRGKKSNKTGVQKVQMNYCRERKEKLKAVVAMLENKTTNLEDDITLLEIKVHARQIIYDDWLIKEKPTQLLEKRIGNAAKSKQESSDALDKLLREASAMSNNEFKESEDELRRPMGFADQLLKLAPIWQAVKGAEYLKAKDPQMETNTTPEEVADSKCVGTALKSGPDGTLPLECDLPILQSEKLSTDLFHISYCSSEKTMEIYFSDPLEVIDLYTVQTKRILILHQYFEARVQKLKDIKQDVKEMKEKVSHLEENLSIQESDIKTRFEMEDRIATKFRRGVQLNEILKTETQDVRFTTTARRVTEIYSCLFKKQLIYTPTREKLRSVIQPNLDLIKKIEKIPEHVLQIRRDVLIKARISEHKLQQEMEREKEKQKKCKRALAVRQKMPGRKLMERSCPLQKRVEVKKEPSDVQDTAEGWLFHHILSK